MIKCDTFDHDLPLHHDLNLHLYSHKKTERGARKSLYVADLGITSGTLSTSRSWSFEDCQASSQSFLKKKKRDQKTKRVTVCVEVAAVIGLVRARIPRKKCKIWVQPKSRDQWISGSEPECQCFITQICSGAILSSVLQWSLELLKCYMQCQDWLKWPHASQMPYPLTCLWQLEC